MIRRAESTGGFGQRIRGACAVGASEVKCFAARKRKGRRSDRVPFDGVTRAVGRALRLFAQRAFALHGPVNVAADVRLAIALRGCRRGGPRDFDDDSFVSGRSRVGVIVETGHVCRTEAESGGVMEGRGSWSWILLDANERRRWRRAAGSGSGGGCRRSRLRLRREL